MLCFSFVNTLHADLILDYSLNEDPSLRANQQAQNQEKAPDISVGAVKVKTAPVVINDVASQDEFPIKDLVKIQNDKEATIASFDQEDVVRIKNKYTIQEDKEKILNVFIKNLYSFLNNQPMHCEPKYFKDLVTDLNAINVKTEKEELLDTFKMMRVENAIDDVFYNILEQLTIDYFAFQTIDLKSRPIKNIFKNYDKKAQNINLDNLFAGFKTYPDEVSNCSYIEFFKIRESIGLPSDKPADKNNLLKDLAYLAYTKNIITMETFHKIKFLSKNSTIQQRRVWLSNYLRIIFSAKNKMVPVKREYKVTNLSLENGFSSEHIARFNKITRRQLLYSKYDENQIILLAQIMKKASQRMGVDPDTKTGIPYMIQEFNILNGNGETQNYVEKIELDTQDQFNLARKLLRKDMTNLQMMDSFLKVTVTYQDIVMASLETGYLTLDDIEYVVKYDDLWNPDVSKFERYMSLTFKVAGYATFFVPPPWNVTAALTLSIIEGVVNSKHIDGASNDNPNTIID